MSFAEVCVVIRCSVVVPTFGNSRPLARLLEGLARQTLPPDEFEVVICDDSGTDETRTRVEQWSTVSGVATSYVRPATPGRGAAAMRNVGWRSARAEVIAFTDDDTVPDPDWLRQGLIALADDAADAATGHVDGPLTGRPTDYDGTPRLDGTAFVTANCFCRRSVLTRIGGFDPRFRTPGLEDSDLYFALIERGFDIIEAHDAIVVRPARAPSLTASLHAENRRLYDALLYKKYPKLYERVVRADRPYLYYAILFALLVAGAGAAAASTPLIVGGLVTWCVLTGVLVRRRLRIIGWRVPHLAEVVATSLILPFLSVYWRLRGGVAFRVAFW